MNVSCLWAYLRSASRCLFDLVSDALFVQFQAKHPASTVQILGAEKALFKALKTKHDTPKYGLIYHAQIVGQASTKLKGKASRMLAAKASLACRVDALSEEATSDIGMEQRARVEARMRQLEGGHVFKVSGTGKKSAKFDKYENKSEVVEYKTAADSTMKDEATPKKVKVEADGDAAASGKKRKLKEEKEAEVEADEAAPEKKKKKKKAKQEEEEAAAAVVEAEVEVKDEAQSEKKKKKKKQKEEPQEEEEMEVEASAEVESAKKKKKKKKKAADSDDDE